MYVRRAQRQLGVRASVRGASEARTSCAASCSVTQTGAAQCDRERLSFAKSQLRVRCDLSSESSLRKNRSSSEKSGSSVLPFRDSLSLSAAARARTGCDCEYNVSSSNVYGAGPRSLASALLDLAAASPPRPPDFERRLACTTRTPQVTSTPFLVIAGASRAPAVARTRRSGEEARGDELG